MNRDTSSQSSSGNSGHNRLTTIVTLWLMVAWLGVSHVESYCPYTSFQVSGVLFSGLSSDEKATYCDGTKAICMSAANKYQLMGNFSTGVDPTKYQLVNGRDSLSGEVSYVFSQCVSSSQLYQFNSVSSMYVNDVAIFKNRQNLGKNDVRYTCASSNSCSSTLSAKSTIEDHPYAAGFNLSSSGVNTVLLEYQSNMTSICASRFYLTLCYVPIDYKIVDYSIVLNGSSVTMVSQQTYDNIVSDPFSDTSKVLDGVSPYQVRRLEIRNRALLAMDNFTLSMSLSSGSDYLNVSLPTAIMKETTDSLTGTKVLIDISSSVTLIQASSYKWDIQFTQLPITKDDVIYLDLKYSANNKIQSTNINYELRVSADSYYDIYNNDNSLSDSITVISRSKVTLNLGKTSTIKGTGLLSDLGVLQYSPTQASDSQFPQCYVQINLEQTSWAKTGFILFVYSSKTKQEYQMTIGSSYTTSQVLLTPDMLDCTVGTTTTFYFKIEVPTSSESFSFGFKPSSKFITIIDDQMKNVPLTFATKKDSVLVYVKSYSEKLPQNITLQTTYSYYDSPFNAMYSNSFTSNFADTASTLTLTALSGNYAYYFGASSIYIKTGTYFSFTESACSTLPCQATLTFSTPEGLINPPALTTSKQTTITLSGYRSDGFITAITIPKSKRSIEETSNTLQPNLVMKIQASVSRTSSFSSYNPVTYGIQVSKGMVGPSQNPPYNSPLSQQIASQNYVNTYPCSSSDGSVYLSVNVLIQNDNDYGTWYISAFPNDTSASFSVKYDIYLNSVMSTLTPRIDDYSNSVPILFAPITTSYYGVKFNCCDESSVIYFKFDAYTLGMTNQLYQIYLKVGSVPSETDYHMKSPPVSYDYSKSNTYSTFYARLINSNDKIITYVMDNSYYSDPTKKYDFSPSDYTPKVLSKKDISNSDTLYIMMRPVYDNSVCITSYSSISGSSNRVVPYLYKSTPALAGGKEEFESQAVVTIDPSKLTDGKSSNNKLIVDLSNDYAGYYYNAEPMSFYMLDSGSNTIEEINSTLPTVTGTSLEVHNFTYRIAASPSAKFNMQRFTLRTQLVKSSLSGGFSQTILMVFPISDMIISNNKFKAITRLEKVYNPNEYLLTNLTSSIITVAVILGIGVVSSAILAAFAIVVITMRKDFNFGTIKTGVWLGCLCPFSCPVSVCYLYFFLHEARRPPVTQQIKRMRRTRFLLAIAAVFFLFGSFFCLYLYGRMALIHISVEQSTSNVYTLGKRQNPNVNIGVGKLMPCCAQPKIANDVTYFGVTNAFYKVYASGSLDCIPDPNFQPDIFRTAFKLLTVDGVTFVPPSDAALSRTSSGTTNAFEQLTLLCVGNSVILTPEQMDYGAFGIPAAFVGILPIVYAFLMLGLVVFEKVYNVGKEIPQTASDQQSLLINDETRDSIYAPIDEQPIQDFFQEPQPSLLDVQSSSEPVLYESSAPSESLVNESLLSDEKKPSVPVQNTSI